MLRTGELGHRDTWQIEECSKSNEQEKCVKKEDTCTSLLAIEMSVMVALIHTATSDASPLTPCLMHAFYVPHGTYPNAYYTSSRLGTPLIWGMHFGKVIVDQWPPHTQCTLKALSNFPCRHDVRTPCIGIPDVDVLTTFLGLL